MNFNAKTLNTQTLSTNLMGVTPVIKASSMGAFSIFKFIRKYWYWIVLIIIIIPSIISSVKIAKVTNNPLYPVIQFGFEVLNADALIQKEVQLLETDPAQLIGMEKPEKGIWKTAKYYWKFFWNVIFKLFSHVWMISFPFVILYKIVVNPMELSKRTRNIFLSVLYGSLLLLFLNMALMIYTLIQGGSILLKIPPDMDSYKTVWFIIYNSMPFHGLISLVKYIITLF